MLILAMYEMPLSYTLTNVVLTKLCDLFQFDVLIVTFKFKFNCVSYYYIMSESSYSLDNIHCSIISNTEII